MNNIRWKKTVKKAVALMFLGFILLTLGRFIYSFFIPPEELNHSRWDFYQQFTLPSPSGILSFQSNLQEMGISTDKVFQAENLNRLEVLEETATVSATTAEFDKDKEKLFALTKEFKGKIMYERSEGLSPNRSLNITFTVNEKLFGDSLKNVADIAKIRGKVVTRTDRTAEFRALAAKKQSSQKYLESLSNLRKVSAEKLEDLITLEGKIQEVQREIENLAIQLGDFTQEEPLSNISYSLLERRGITAYSLDRRLLDAVLWSVFTYSYLIGAIVVIVLVYCSIVALKE
jgi:hypothetical protein